MLILRSLLVCVLALAAIPAAHAAAAEKPAPNIYHVEIIVFRNTDPKFVAEEAWPDTFGIKTVDRLIYTALPGTPAGAVQASAATKPATPPPFELLPASEFKLTGSVAKMKRLPAYEVLLHTAWRQPGIDLQENSAVYIREGMTQPETTLPPPTGEPAVVDAALSGLDDTLPTPRFSGTVKLAVGRYLHVALDLIYREMRVEGHAVNAEGAEIEAPREMLRGYQLTEMRRIKTGEVHYFDHPAFGVLVLVAPTEKSKATNVEKETVGADRPVPATMPDD